MFCAHHYKKKSLRSTLTSYVPSLGQNRRFLTEAAYYRQHRTIGRYVDSLQAYIPGIQLVELWSTNSSARMGIREFRKKEMKTKQKMLSEWCSWRVIPGFGNLFNQICSGYMTWTCLDFFTIFHNKFRASCCLLYTSPSPRD